MLGKQLSSQVAFLNCFGHNKEALFLEAGQFLVPGLKTPEIALGGLDEKSI